MLVGVYLAVRSTVILLGQIGRKELVSLKHIHIVLLALVIVDAYLCINSTRIAWLSQHGESEALVMCILLTAGLVCCPYVGLVAYRVYQSRHRERYLPARDLGALSDPDGIRDAVIVTAVIVGFISAVLCAQYVPRYLMIAASKSGNRTLLKQLLTVGASPNVRTEGGMTPLAFACRDNDLERVRVLLDAKANVNFCGPILPLSMASRHNDLTIFRLLLDRGVEANASDHFTTLLMAVAQQGTPEAVKLLLERGADVNGKNLIGDTALMHACISKRVDTAKLLIEHGADVNATGTTGRTALLDACYSRRPDLVAMLLEKGADMSAKRSYDGKTSLMIASEEGQAEMVRALLTAGADVSAKDLQKNTAMTLAEKRRHKEVIRILAEHGRQGSR